MNFYGLQLSAQRVAAGLLIGGTALWLAFRGATWNDLAPALRQVDLLMVAAALASTGLTLFAGTLRWQLLFYPRHRGLRLTSLFHATVVGQMVNIVSPVRLGEIARVYTLAQREQLSKAQVVATLALEKVLDLVVFGLAVALLLTLMVLPEGVRVRTSAQLGVGAAALALLWCAAHFGLPLARVLEQRLPPLPPRWRDAARSTVNRFVEGLFALTQMHVGATLFLLSVVVICCSALTNYLLFMAFGFTLPAWAALFLLVLLQVGAVPPSLPGKIGVFNYLVVVGLGVFGVSRADALSYSILLYAVALLPKVLLGAAFLVAAPLRLRPAASPQ